MGSLDLEVAKIIFVCQTNQNFMPPVKQISKLNLGYPESIRERGTA